MKEWELQEHCQYICAGGKAQAFKAIAHHTGAIEWDIQNYLETREVRVDEFSESLAHLHICLALCVEFFGIDRNDLDRYLNGIVGGDGAIPIQQRYAAGYSDEQRNSDAPLEQLQRRSVMLTIMLTSFGRSGVVVQDLLMKVLGDIRLGMMEIVCRFGMDQKEIEERIDYLLDQDE